MEQVTDQIYDAQFALEVAEFLVAMDRQTPSIPTVLMSKWVIWGKWAKAFLENRDGERSSKVCDTEAVGGGEDAGAVADAGHE